MKKSNELKTAKEMYEAPVIEIVEVVVEQGFLDSTKRSLNDPTDDEPTF